MAKRQTADLPTGAGDDQEPSDIDQIARHFLSVSSARARTRIVSAEIEKLQRLSESDYRGRIHRLAGFLDDPASAFQHVSAPDQEFLKIVAAKTPEAVLKMAQPDPEVLSIALSTKIELLSQVGPVSDELLILVVQRNPLCLISMENPGENIQLAAVESAAGIHHSEYAAFGAKLTFDSALKTFLRKCPQALPYLPQHNEISAEVVEACLEGLKSIERIPGYEHPFKDACNCILRYLSRDQLIELGHIYPPAFEKVDNLTENELAPHVEKDPRLIERIEKPSTELQKRAVLAADKLRMGGYILKHIKNPDEVVVRAVIARDPEQLRFVASPNEELQRLAVRMIIGEPLDSSGNRIGKLEDSLYQTLARQLMAVLEGVNIGLGVQIELVACDYRFIALISNASAESQMYVLNSLVEQGNILGVEWFLSNVGGLTPEVQIAAVSHDPGLILKLPGACQEAIRMAIEKKPALAAHILEKFPEIQGINALRLETEWTAFSIQPEFPKHPEREPRSSGGNGL